jgi:hypothetical protein
VNEQHFNGDVTLERHESHEGHKIQVGNNIKICYFNDASRCDEPYNHIATCNVLIKVHQGTATADAIVNNLHEVFLFAKCDQAGAFYNYGGFSNIPLNHDRTYGHLGSGFSCSLSFCMSFLKLCRIILTTHLELNLYLLYSMFRPVILVATADIKMMFMDRFYKPGVINTIDGCPLFLKSIFDLKVDSKVFPYSPPTSPDGNGARKVFDNTCIDEQYLVPEGSYSIQIGKDRRNTEHWVVSMESTSRPGPQFQSVSAFANPYMTTFDAARYYDATSPETKFSKYFIDLCYATGSRQVRESPDNPNKQCTKVRNASPDRPNRMTFDDTRSPFKGTTRNISPNRLTVNNPGPATVFYSDTYGNDLVADPSVCGAKKDGKNCLKQFIGIGTVEDCGADIFLPTKDWGEGFPSIHAPN